ncbi:MAG: cupin domain-containing protein [Gaiellaceae bacterium]
MRRFNLFAAEVEYDATDPEEYRAGMARFGSLIGATMLGGTVYELPPGQSNCPYHYEYGNEEWLIVLEGRLTLRHPEGEDELDPGDVVSFPVGPDGAHKLTNRTESQVRVLMLSTQHEPSVAVYPDSDKIGLWPGDRRDHILVRRESGVDYWDREA